MQIMTIAGRSELHNECGPVRYQFVPAIKRALELNQGPIKIVGQRGSGRESTVHHVLNDFGCDLVIHDVGHKYSRGYFAGFSKLLFTILESCEARYPSVIERHEHSLKRLFPLLASPSFNTPKDL